MTAEATTATGFLGLGIMGGPMAVDLAAADHNVIGYDAAPVRR
jgi:3-hydroxyisobutyrate dehydrogenase-like beta-hydroxyacid dehydrogenase